MVTRLPSSSTSEQIIYPDCDGKPLANNTVQFRWIVTIKENLETLFADNPNFFVAGDLFWYPVQGRNTITVAPDIMAVFGRPKGDRLSYQQWQEDNIPPQVIFEIISPSNTQDEMDRKLLFFDRHGVEEYYIYDPDRNNLRGWLRGEDGLDVIDLMDGWVSPRMQIRFHLTPETLNIYRPDGDKFLTYTQMFKRMETERQRAQTAEQKQREAIPKLIAMGLNQEQIAEALGLSVEEVTGLIE